MVKVKKATNEGNKKDFPILPKLASLIEETYNAFGITTRVAEINRRPKDFEFCLEIALGNSIDEITQHRKDIAMALASPTGEIEIEAPIPGRSLIAIRVPYTTEWVELQKKSFENKPKIDKKESDNTNKDPISAKQIIATGFYLVAAGFGKIGNLIDNKK